MALDLTVVSVKEILTRTTGYLAGVTTHSLQPYRGCTFGNALCGAGCYVRHSFHVTHGRRWGGFLEVRQNAAEAYRATVDRERRWAARRGRPFSIFLSSATDPFLPQEAQYGITQSLLKAMCQNPPDELTVQTHTHQVTRRVALLERLAACCRLRVHVSIESDRDSLPGLPPPASPVADRIEACRTLRARGLATVVTVAPLLPVHDPDRFFATLADVADAVVIDHFIEGDGSALGARTLRTALPAGISAIEPGALRLDYRDLMVARARQHLPGRVGVSRDGFAGRYA